MIAVGSSEASKTNIQAENLSFHSYSEAAEHNEEYFLILRFDDILSSENRRDLETSGVTLEGYIPSNTYVARVSRNVELSTLSEFGLNGYARAGAENKIQQSFYQFLETEKGGSFLIRASFSSSLSEADVRNSVALQAGVSNFILSPGSRYFTAELTPKAVFEIAKLPFINAIEPHSDKVVIDGGSSDSDYLESSHSDVQVTNIRANVIKSTESGRLGLTGDGVVVGLGDAVYQGETHVDMRDRHTVLDPGLGNNGSFSQHGNHTSGIVGGNGSLQPRFEGLAAQSTIYTMRTGDHFALGLNQPDPTVISSNSWNSSDPEYGDWYEQKGRYNIHSQTIDELLRNENKLLSVFSAGNSGATQEGYPEDYLTLNPSYGAAKNTLVVGRYANPIWVSIVSSYGPARDGRIKPDVVAQNKVHSGVAFNGYERFQGSSQSTPAVAGAAALLYEHYRNLHSGETPDGGLVKSILMNTADYIFDEGPSYAAGYGLVNARRAAQIITSSQYQIADVEQGQSFQIVIEVPSTIEGNSISQLKVMLYWTDKDASPYAAPALVNNLDLLVSDGSIDHQPWVLDSTRANVALPATRGTDSLNNTEQVVIDAPPAGSYTATISGTSVPFGPQEFYLVYSYVLDELVVTHPLGDDKFFSGQNKVIFWDTQDTGDERDADDVEYSLDSGATWTPFFGNSTVPRQAATWTVPESALGEALVRVTQGGRTTVSEPFTISEKVSLSIDVQGSGDADITWNEVLGAAAYELLKLSDANEWEVFETLPDTTVTIEASRIAERTAWFSVRAVDDGGTIRSQRADARRYVSRNAPPVAVEDVVVIDLNAITTFDALANDSDQDGDTLYIRDISSAEHGEASVRDNQVIRYWPDTDYAGLDSFTYTIDDGHGGTSIGTITVSVASGVSTEDDLAIPTEFRLMGNYPNPFNPSTTIRYALPVSSPVQLSVYDALGRRVALLVDSQVEAGWHNVTFESRSLASGMYFYRLEARNFNLTRTMFLLK